MPRYIVKLDDYYLEWSTVVDAPVTPGMVLNEFKEYYRSAYGDEAMNTLDERLARVDSKGTSSILDDSAESLIRGNRAGEHETELSKAQIIDFYCLNQRTGDRPLGNTPDYGDDG